MSKSYSELMEFESFEERFEYLQLHQRVGDPTFGYDRHINQVLYKLQRWLAVRDEVIVRDDGCDLGIEGRPILTTIIVHHIDPISVEDILNDDPKVWDLDNLICTAKKTHDAIHFSNISILPHLPKPRTRNDTCPWK